MARPDPPLTTPLKSTGLPWLAVHCDLWELELSLCERPWSPFKSIMFLVLSSRQARFHPTAFPCNVSGICGYRPQCVRLPKGKANKWSEQPKYCWTCPCAQTYFSQLMTTLFNLYQERVNLLEPSNCVV